MLSGNMTTVSRKNIIAAVMTGAVEVVPCTKETTEIHLDSTAFTPATTVMGPAASMSLSGSPPMRRLKWVVAS